MKKKFEAYDSETLHRAEQAIAHGALTNSKRPESFVKGFYPTHVTREHGAYVWDTRGNRYIDYICALGANLIGYAHEEITGAIVNQAQKGISFSLSTELEVKVAERLKEFFPWAERVRFLKSGSEACSAAVRIARAATGRKQVLSRDYHGWHDAFVGLTPPAVGVSHDISMTTFESLDQISLVTAAVIIEPVVTKYDPDRMEWLRLIRKRCSETGTVLIFDEVITGFRYQKYGVCNASGIEPDLICLGKALGGGMDVAAVMGKRDLMESDYFVSSTFAGEAVSLAAAYKLMDLLQKKYSLETLWAAGADFQKRFNAISSELISIEGYPTRGIFKCKDDFTKGLFFQECCRAGILVGPSFFFSFPHMEHSDAVISTMKDILGRIGRNEVKLEGELPKTPFAQRVRQS